MDSCRYHRFFFNQKCETCRHEYLLLKGLELKENWIIRSKDEVSKAERPDYKQFSEVRAKELYERLFIYYLKKTGNEYDASNKAKTIIRKQCNMRNLTHWSWL